MTRASILLACACIFPVTAVEPVFLQSATDVTTIEDLEAWRSKQLALIASNLPNGRQEFARHSIEKEHNHRMAQLNSDSSAKPDAQLPALLYLERVHNCNNMDDLDMWRERQVTKVREVVPAEYQHVGIESIDKEYEKHAALFRGTSSVDGPSNLPVLMMNAEEFKTRPELNAWRDEQAAQIERFVPQDFRGFAYDSIEKEFTSLLAQLALVDDAEAFPQNQSNQFTFLIAGFAVLFSAVGFGVYAHRRRPAGDLTTQLLGA